jgi:hypothetical protein
MTYPRHFGHVSDLERDHLRYGDWSDEKWALGALFGLFLSGLIGLYAFSGDRPMSATGPADETTGHGTRPTLPTLPN